MGLNRTYRQRIGILENLMNDPFLRRLHGDPRFDGLMRKLKLVE